MNISWIRIIYDIDQKAASEIIGLMDEKIVFSNKKTKKEIKLKKHVSIPEMVFVKDSTFDMGSKNGTHHNGTSLYKN